jgi:hypothetical protein
LRKRKPLYAARGSAPLPGEVGRSTVLARALRKVPPP